MQSYWIYDCWGLHSTSLNNRETLQKGIQAPIKWHQRLEKENSYLSNIIPRAKVHTHINTLRSEFLSLLSLFFYLTLPSETQCRHHTGTIRVKLFGFLQDVRQTQATLHLDEHFNWWFWYHHQKKKKKVVVHYSTIYYLHNLLPI